MSSDTTTAPRASRAVGHKVLRPLGYTGRVRITDGPFAERIRNAVDTYLSLPPDDVLYGFRLQAGQDAPGSPMTGWSSKTTEATFGQWLSGLTRIGVTAGEPAAIERAVYLAHEWWKTIEPGADHRMGGYGIEKVVGALVDLAEFGGHPEMLDLVEPIAAASSAAFTRARPIGDAVDFEGGILSPTRTLEWYTLAENFYRAWLLGADDSVREFAEEWHYDAYWSHFAERPAPGQPWDVPVWLHAYSHLNTFASAASLYDVTGDERYLRILRNAHEYFTTTQLYATGGYGPGELTLPEDGTLGASVEMRTDNAEIVCGSWAAFKLSSALITDTGEALYGDWVEQLLYNGIGAVTPVDVTGRSPYYQDYRLGIATKLPHWDDWPCCSGTYIQNVAHLPDLVYFAGDDGIAVNLFLPSVVEWEHDGVPLSIIQKTEFPVTDTSTLEIGGDGPIRFVLKIRVPGWTSGMSISVNGEDADVAVVPGQWAEIDREWAPGDRVELVLGARLRAMPIDSFHPNRVAFAHGPVVLAQTAEWTSPVSLPTPWPMVDLTAAFTREEGLTYRPNSVGTARLPQGTLKPLAEYPDRFPYRVYFDLDHPRII